MFGKAKKNLFSRLLELPDRIPSHDTFGRVFAKLDSAQFEECLKQWVRSVNDVTGGEVVAIDGKTHRRSHDRSAIHMVSKWASANRLILGQTKVDKHSSEITAIPELLSMLDVSGCAVTIDALRVSEEIAAMIFERRATASRKHQNALRDRKLCPLGVGRSLLRRRQQGKEGQCSAELIRVASHGNELAQA